jgi:sulfite exporter TauE/SafE
MRHRTKSHRVGSAGLVLRYGDGTCTHECRSCGTWEAFARWRPALRSARAHAADHATGATNRYALTPAGSRLVGRSPRRRSPLRRLATVLVGVLLAVLAFAATVAGMASRAAPVPPAIGIVTTTTAAAPRPEAGYSPAVAGTPATDAQGQWIPQPDPTSTGKGPQGGGR